MAQILKNVRLFTGGADLTSVGNKVELSPEVEEKDVTTFGSYDSTTDKIWKEVMAGNKSAKISAGGFWEAGDDGKVDDAAWIGLGGVGAWTIAPNGAAVGDLAWLTNALEARYQLLGSQGDVAPWSASVSSSLALARGVLLHPPGTARTATGDGTAVQHIAVPSGSQLVAALHVLSVSGTGTPTITVKVQSDDNSGMTTPTDRITFTAFTDQGGEVKYLSGPVTDTYYRVSWTISGTSPSFLFVVSLGVA